MLSKVETLRDRASLIWNLYGCRSLLGWDHQVLMPPGGATSRANQMATLSRVSHELLVSVDFRRVLEEAEAEVACLSTDSEEFCLVRAARRQYDRYAKVPSKLVEDLARTCAQSLDSWVTAKRDN